MRNASVYAGALRLKRASPHRRYEYYIDPLLAARIDMEVVQDLVALMMPKLHRHFRSVGFDIGAVCFQWLFSLFVTCLVPTVILRIWDAFLVQSCKSAEAGREVLFRCVISLRPTAGSAPWLFPYILLMPMTLQTLLDAMGCGTTK